MRLKKTFKVKLEDGDESAVFEFKKPPLNRLFDAGNPNDSQIERLKKEWQVIAGDLISIEGLEHEDGSAVKVEEVKDFALDFITMKSLVVAYGAAVYGLKGAEPEKKESKPE